MGYEKGDDVIVYASKQKHDKLLTEFSICSVVAVGEYDLICKKDSKFCNNLFAVSKQRCEKILKKIIPPKAFDIKPPIVGDLITSITESYDKKRTEITGIVEEIIYDPSSRSKPYYIVRIGLKTEVVYFDNTIILNHET